MNAETIALFEALRGEIQEIRERADDMTSRLESLERAIRIDEASTSRPAPASAVISARPAEYYNSWEARKAEEARRFREQSKRRAEQEQECLQKTIEAFREGRMGFGRKVQPTHSGPEDNPAG